jgi:hypothetical protein
MVIQNNTKIFTNSSLTQFIHVKGGSGNTGFNTSIYWAQPDYSVEGMTITVRKLLNMGQVDIIIYQTNSYDTSLAKIIPVNSVTPVSSISIDSSKSTAIFHIMGGYFYQDV